MLTPMNMKLNIIKIALLIILSCWTLTAVAQKVTLKGTVLNRNAEKLEFVYVSLLKNDSVQSAIAMTDRLGNFTINIDKGGYLLLLEQFGQKLYQNKIELERDTDLNSIIVDESVHLEGVTITSSRKTVERKIDRIVFNVDKTLSATGGNAWDVLKITPGLRVESQTISMIGKNTVSVMIDGRLMQLAGDGLSSFLATISSEDIKTIEVITNPPARYSAEGNSGLINIVLKGSKKDYIGGSIRSSYQRSAKNKGYFGADFSYQRNKTSAFANFTLGKGSSERTESMKVFYPNQLWEQSSDQEVFTSSLSGRAGVDYDLTNKTSIGIQYLVNANKPDLNETILTHIYKIKSLYLDSTITTKGDADSKYHSHSVNLHFKTKLDTLGHNLTIDFDYLNYENNMTRLNTSFLDIADASQSAAISNIQNSMSDQNIKAYTSKLDLDLPISLFEMSIGGKLSVLRNHSGNDIREMDGKEVLQSETTDRFRYTENTQSAYVNFNKKVKKFEFQGGLRLEATQTKGRSVVLNQVNKNEYIKLFPTLFVTYEPNDVNNLSLSYGRRISRPYYQRLNPFKWYSNPYSYSEGNPFLLPSYTDNVELTHTYNNSLTSAIYFSKTTDGTDQVTLVDTKTNMQATVWKNYIDDYSIGLTESYNFNLIKWLDSYAQVNLNYLKVKSTIPSTVSSKEGANFFFSINNHIFFNAAKTIIGEVNYWYNASGTDGVYDISSSSCLDLGLKFSFMNKKLDLVCNASDIFKTNIATIKGLSNNIEVQYRNYYFPRNIRFSVVYRFGNKSLKSKQQKLSNEEERQRLN